MHFTPYFLSPFSVTAAWKSINRWCTSVYCTQHFSNICLIVTIWSAIDLPLWNPPSNLPLFPQHKVLIIHIQYLPECYMLYIALWLLYNYHTSLHPLSNELDILWHISTYVVWSRPPMFFKWVKKWLSWALFLPLWSVWPGFDHVQLLFLFSTY